MSATTGSEESLFPVQEETHGAFNSEVFTSVDCRANSDEFFATCLRAASFERNACNGVDHLVVGKFVPGSDWFLGSRVLKGHCLPVHCDPEIRRNQFQRGALDGGIGYIDICGVSEPVASSSS